MLNVYSKLSRHQRPNRRIPAFTLIELLVVLFVIVVILGIMIPAVKAMLRSNGQSQAVNLIRAQIAAARTIAIAQHRQAGVVFFEEGTRYSPNPNTNQTAMQLIVEDPNQAQHGINYTAHPENTVFIYYSRERSYLPAGIQVATLNDARSTSNPLITSDTAGARSRVILFNANGQMTMRNGIMRPDLGGSSPPPSTSDPYPFAYGDWFKDPGGTTSNNPNDTASNGVSTPGIAVYSLSDYKTYVTQASPSDAQKAVWIETNADILIVNTYTGSIIR